MDKYELARSSTDPIELDRLSKGSDLSVRAYVAQNDNTKEKTLDRLSKDFDPVVRRHTAKNKNLKTETLDKLVEDSDQYVRYWVAGNENTSISALVKLIEDEDSTVSKEAKKNLNRRDVLGDLLGESAGPMHDFRILASTSTDPNELRKLAEYTHGSRVYAIVAKNTNCDEATLDNLAKRNDTLTRWNVARNPSTTIPTLVRLLSDENSNVAHQARENLKSRDILGDLLGESKCYESFQEWASTSRVK